MAMEQGRYNELKKILEEKRRKIFAEVSETMKEVRIKGRAESETKESEREVYEGDVQDDIEFALIQMKSETLHKLEEALAMLEAGTFGFCFECSHEISEKRLRELPFAVRCKDCEMAREIAEQRERILSQRRAGGYLFDL